MLLTHHARNARRVLGLLLIAGSSAQAQTYGMSSPLVAGQNLDAFSQFLSISSIAFQPTSFGGTLSTFSVFGGLVAPGGTGGNNVNALLTPVLAREVAGTWTIEGVGTARTIASGVNTWDFGLTSGTATIAAGMLFGWWSPTSGAVQYTLGGDGVFFSDNQAFPSSPTAGQTFTAPLSEGRTYSIQWTVAPASTSTVPEPSTYALMGAGLVAILALRRRQRAA